MSLRDSVAKDMTAAMKAGEKLKLSALRMLLSSIKYKEIDLKRPLNDEETRQVISTLVRQRQDSITQFRAGGREDLAEKEEAEMGTLKAYLPRQLSPDEVRGIVLAAASSINASDMKDMGRLMKEVMPKVKGMADGKLINDIVREILGS